ncbi:MAG: hypothetical protein AB2A00_43645, partial [Myxococcota bacterium]
MFPWIATLLLAGQTAAPSIGVLSLRAELGVNPSAAMLLTDNMTQLVRDWGRFSRVVTFKEVEDALALEKTKQLVDCDSQSCLSEIAGALGVDLLLVGAVGRLGNATLMNLKIIRARNAELVASVSERIDGPVDRALDLIPYATGLLLDRGKLMHPNLVPPAHPDALKPAVEPVAQARTATPLPAPIPDEETPPAAQRAGPRPLRVVGVGLGGVGLAVGAVGAVAAVALVTSSL